MSPSTAGAQNKGPFTLVRRGTDETDGTDGTDRTDGIEGTDRTDRTEGRTATDPMQSLPTQLLALFLNQANQVAR